MMKDMMCPFLLAGERITTQIIQLQERQQGNSAGASARPKKTFCLRYDCAIWNEEKNRCSLRSGGR